MLTCRILKALDICGNLKLTCFPNSIFALLVLEVTEHDEGADDDEEHQASHHQHRRAQPQNLLPFRLDD